MSTNKLPPVTTVEAVGGDHRELRDGEIFLGNGNEKGFEQLSYQTKRRGKLAYDISGKKVLPQYFPVFCSAKEYEKLHSK